MPPARGGSVYCQRRVCWLVLVFGLCAMSGLLPKAASQTVYSECGGELSAMQGTIVSPELTSVPSGGTECVWTITPLSDMNSISLSANLNNFLWSPGCADSVLEMSDLPIGPNHVRMCDNEVGRHYMTSYGKKGRVRLFVTPAHQNVSFSVTWKSWCEVQMTNVGTFHSPGFPDSYLANQHCSYNFRSDSTYGIKITFTAFNIPATDVHDCPGNDYFWTNDYFDMYGRYQYSLRYCGTDLPRDITRADVFRVYFSSSEARGAGFGFEAVYTKQLRCDAASLTKAHGTIQFPSNNYDKIEGSCTWPIMVDVGRTVVLAFDLYFSNDKGVNDMCETNYVKIYDGPTKNDNLLGTFCQTNGYHIVQSSSNSLVMEFYTDGSSLNSDGKAVYNSISNDVACRNVILDGPKGNITLCGASGLSQVWLRNGVYRWTVTVEEGFVIQLAFQTFNIDLCAVSCNYDGSSQCQNSSLTVYDGLVEQKSAAIATLCGWDQPWMMTSTTNSMVVVLVLGQERNFTRAALSAHYRAVDGSQVKRDCGDRTLSGTGGVITSPNFPNYYDNLLDCEWTITVDEDFTVQIDVLQFSLQTSSNCMYDSVQVRDGNNISAPYLLSPHCDQYYSYWHYTLSSQTNEMFIKLVTDLTGTSTGFNATWRRTCVRSNRANTDGTLQSPYYPENYPSHLSCQYTLYLYQPGTLLVFNFTSLSLEPASSNGSCVNDYVEIREQAPQMGPGSKFERRERYCGSTLPTEFTTYHHTVVSFVTNGEVSSSGYQLTYSLVNNMECGSSVLSGQQGIVTSPNYPGSYPAPINCTQTLQAAEGETISLVFDDWLMSNFRFNPGMEGEECLQRERNGELNGGLLKIFDGPEADNASNALGVYCGQAAPLPVTSTSNSLTLVFRSYDNWNFWTGFSATFNSSANSTECRDGTYGPGCPQTCACNTRNTLSCNKLNGACTCKGGWEGATCDDDIDECSPPSGVTCTAHAQCVNTQGGYLCVCDIGYTNVDGNCVACDANHYGENCAQICDCSVNSLSCNKVNGACACKAGWESARCDVDVDECTMGSAGCSGDHVVCINTQGGFSCDCDKGYARDDANICVDKDECFSQESDCLHLCNNTIGGYVCSCGPEYQGTGNDCTELPRVPALVTVDIPVPASELANPYSDIYKKWVSDVRQALYEKLKLGVPGLKLVIIQSLRPGSLIADTVFVVDTQNQPNTISALSSAILALMGGQLDLRNYTGSVTLNIHGIMVNQSVTLCDVYVAISPCGVNEECQETSGIASCVPTEEEHEEDVDLDLVIGLAVSLPMALLIAGVIGVAVYLHKRPNVKTLPQVNHDEVYSVSPASSNLHGGKPGLGQIDTRWIMAPSPISASPVPSLDSILPDMDSRPSSRKGSWTDNM